MSELDRLLAIPSPVPPADFESFWRIRRERAALVAPEPVVRDTGRDLGAWRISEVSYASTDGMRVKGWLLRPRSGPPRRGFLVGHGYGGTFEPQGNLPFTDSALLYFCARGLGLSRHQTISSDPAWHVLHDIHDRNRYVLGGCVDDVWCGVSALLHLHQELLGHMGYLGISFSGGVGAMAMPWEDRVQKSHFNVPTFGNQPLRLKIPSTGSAASVQSFARKNPGVVDTLAYYDSATAARFLKMPAHFACALVDPAVAPEGQFSIHNAVPGKKALFPLTSGHPTPAPEERGLLQEIDTFFRDM